MLQDTAPAATAPATTTPEKPKGGRPRLERDATGKPNTWRLVWTDSQGRAQAEAYADPAPVFSILAAWARHGITPQTLSIETRTGTTWGPV